ncbi:MAG: phospholipase D family protein [Paracoccaceae bacterium]
MLLAEKIEPAHDADDLQIFITAAEAYPEMERAFLHAKREIWASYRVFSLSTRLRSEEARHIGDTWFDLLVHVLKKGVSLHFVLSDFDPILAGDLHCASWQARRAFIAAAEVAGPDARLSVVNAVHSARVGLLPRLLLWPRLVKEISKTAEALNVGSTADRRRAMECRPGLRPWLRETDEGRLEARKWYPPPLVPGSHHQKMAIFDREVLCIGGLDLDERRYDSKAHRRRHDETWHDVQVMCRGPVVEDAQRHVETFLDVVAGNRAPEPPAALLRTISRRRRLQAPFLGPRPIVSELADMHHAAIKRTRHLIYLETQFFRDRKTADALAEAARRRPGLGLILILPGAPEDVAFEGSTAADARFGEYLQAECISTVANAFGDRAAICSPVKPQSADDTDDRDTLCGAPIIYVHAKVSIFDRKQAIVSSANLNGRSLAWDTEAGIALTDAGHVEKLFIRVAKHWLPKDVGPRFLDPKEAAGHWRVLAQANAERKPEARKGFLVPYRVRPAEKFGRRFPGVPEKMV